MLKVIELFLSPGRLNHMQSTFLFLYQNKAFYSAKNFSSHLHLHLLDKSPYSISLKKKHLFAESGCLGGPILASLQTY